MEKVGQEKFYAMSPPALHTIGYEGSSIDKFVHKIAQTGIELLIDVRDVPISRKKGFSKNVLAGHLRAVGVDYLHLKGLGDPKPGRIAAREGRFTEFRTIFGEHLRSKVAQEDLVKGIDAARGRIACLLCFERDHVNCHRFIIGEEMAQRGGFRLVHIALEDPAKPHPTIRGKRRPHEPITKVR